MLYLLFIVMHISNTVFMETHSFQFETIKQNRQVTIFVSYIVLSFILLTLTASKLQMLSVSLILLLLQFIGGYFVFKYSLRTVKSFLEFSEKGITHNNNFIGWRLIKNYRIDHGTGKTEAIRIKTYTNSNINLVFHTGLCNGKKSWTDLKLKLPELMELSKTHVSNYYDSKTWSYIQAILIGSFFVIPLLVYLLQLTLKEIITPYLIYISSLIPLLATINYNRRKFKKEKKLKGISNTNR